MKLVNIVSSVIFFNLAAFAMDPQLDSYPKGISYEDIVGLKNNACCPDEKCRALKNADQNSLLNDDDVRFFYANFADTKFDWFYLRSLNLKQVIALVHNPQQLRAIENRIDPQVAILNIKLHYLLKLSANDLIKRLYQEEVRAWFRQDRSLFTFLMKMMPPVTFEDDSMETALSKCLEAICRCSLIFNDFESDVEYMRREIAMLRNEKSEDPKINDDILELRFREEIIHINQRKMANISRYFQGSYNNIIDLNDFERDEIEILINIANWELPKITFKNLFLLLKTSKDFDIEILREKCDMFVFVNGLPDEVVNEWAKGLRREFSSFFSNRMAFLNNFNLHKSEEKLCKELASCLNELVVEDNIPLKDLKYLNNQQADEVKLHFRGNKFRDKLRDPRFLNWVWPHIAQGESLSFLRKIVQNFCSDEKNKIIVARAWVVTPTALSRTSPNLSY